MNLVTLFFIIIPVLCAIVLACLPEKYKKFKESFFMIAVIFNLWAVCFYFGKSIFSYASWAAFDFSFSIVMSRFAELLLLVVAVFGVLTAIFSISGIKDNPKTSLINIGLLLALSFVNGALITDSFIFLLVFIEAIAIPFVLMIIASPNNNKKLAIKAFTITAVADLFLMMGIALIYTLVRTMNISEVSLELSGAWEITAFVFIMIGAAGKLGVMPFHSWMPEAADKTNVTFLVFMATAAEKVLGIYILLTALKIFNIGSGSLAVYIIMGFVALSAVLAAMLANKQASFKRMLIYTSISQGSFMMLAILTAVPVAVAGAVLHLIAHTVYKSALFFGAGIIDESKETTVSYKNNPYIFMCFILAIASFIGVPFFAVFYSKELIYEGVMNAGVVWYAVMVIVTFFCSTAVLDWFGKIFFGNDGKYVEYPVTSMIPVVTAAFLCLLLGIFRKIPLTIIEDTIPFTEHADMVLVIISVSVLVLVLINFIAGYVKYKNGLGFVGPMLSGLKIDKLNKNDNLDPYNIAIKIYDSFAKASFDFDRGLNWVYDKFFVNSAIICSNLIRKAHNGSMSRYIIWVLVGISVIILFFV